MPTTTYYVNVLDPAGEITSTDTRSKKSTATDLARDLRNDNSSHVQVVTQAGNVVLDLPAPKKIKMSPRFSRVVVLPEGVSVPEGMRVAYTKSRKNSAVLHNAETGQYSVFDYVAQRELGTFETTRAAGRFLTDEVPAPAKPELEVASA